MVAKKRKSKRQTLQQKYKIIKRTKEHHKRLNKGKLVGKVVVKKKNDNHIPNAWPYKEELLKEIQVAKDKMEDLKQRQKDKRREEINKRRMNKNNDTDMEVEDNEEEKMLKIIPNINPVKNDENDDQDEYDMHDGSIEINSKNLGQNSRRAYLKELRKVIDRADVILHVLDARDPIGTKSSSVEELVLAKHQKKLVYVLNKADLVPKDVLSGWLTHLRNFQPTIPFKCNTQNQKENLGNAFGKVTKQTDGALKTNQAVGGEELLGLLKNYSRIGDTKSIISVGIVGFPNVGKSSLINSLMRTRSVGVSSTPGFTKVSQEVILDKNIRLIDSPGIVFADGDSAATALRNCVNVEELNDILTPIQAILDRCPQDYLMQLYSIPRFKEKDCISFLALVAKSTGKLKKGGIPNTDAAGRTILHDWNNGKIKYYCKPPKVIKLSANETESKIINHFSNEFDIDELRDEDIRVINELNTNENESYFSINDNGNNIDMAV
eukprot:gene6905-9457_t